MATNSLPSDPLWPRAGHWLRKGAASAEEPADVGLIGVPAFQTSITPTGAHMTPPAVREALLRYSTYAASRGVDVQELTGVDFGDVRGPDGEAGERRVAESVAEAAAASRLLLAVGGDNSITHSVMKGLFGEDLKDAGLITVDAHHDLRDGVTNGSPVRRLAEAGLPGSSIIQLGIADFANSAAYAQRARDLGIHVVTRTEMRRADLSVIAANALETAGAGGRAIYVDIDVDAADRSVVPACPSAAPGGLSADELRELVFLFARDPRVRAIDFTEVDATIDAPDQRTTRLVALLILEAAAGFASRD